MTGSLQVKRGYYWTAIYLGDGQYDWKNTGLPEKGNKTTAKRILRERIAEAEKLEGLDPKDTFFHDFMVEWLDIIALQVKPSTHHQYELIVNNSVVPFFKEHKVKLRDLKPQHIQKYYIKKMQDGCSGNTVKHHHSNIRKALQYALKQNWIPFNPADRVELPRIERYVGNFYTPDELRQILDLVKGTIIETPVLITATYGLRRSEVLGLKWDAIDFDKKTISIRHTVIGEGQYRYAEDRTKTQASARTLFLVPQVEEHLKRVYAHQRMMQHTCGEGYIQSDYICTWDNGKLISPEYLSRKFRETVSASTEETGLPVYRYHDLRHSSASLLAAEGRSLKEIGEWLGHSSPNATNRYAHLMFQNTVNMANDVTAKLFVAG